MTARLPDLLVIGAPRSGTTTLTHWLREHPEVAVSDRKELEFFDRHHARGTDWYLAQLPEDPGTRTVVEATPTYLSDHNAPDRIAEVLPHARFVAVLREPVARAWSQYWFFVQLGLERRSWGQAVAAEVDGDALGYLWRGRYAEQLARWDALVGADRLHVLLLDDLVRAPDTALAGVCAFAGIQAMTAPGGGSVNPTSLPRSARLQALLLTQNAGAVRKWVYSWNARGRAVPKLPATERSRLHEAFCHDLGLLAGRLGRELPPGWHAPSPSCPHTRELHQGA